MASILLAPHRLLVGGDPPPVPARIAALVIAGAVTAGEVCPITLEPLTEGATACTPCFHCFEREALHVWLARHATCPVCKGAVAP